jgi:uncharacterized protein YutE (UPF0331/DUF86 family)
MLDQDLIKRKSALIQEELLHLTEFESLTLEETARDYRTQAIVERLLERIITRAIDINQHIIAERGTHLPFPRKYRETFLRLADLDVYSKKFGEQIAPSAGFRNALVHDYNNIDKEILRKSIGEAIREFNLYTTYVLDFVAKQIPPV